MDRDSKMTSELKKLLIELSDIEHQLQMMIQSDYDPEQYKQLSLRSDEVRALVCNWVDANLRG
jgi:TATA-box binding protein (TBP) (component of TFIID and TFIIIB)